MMLAMARQAQPNCLKPVYCSACGRYLCKASPGSHVEVKCPSCKRVIVAQIGENES